MVRVAVNAQRLSGVKTGVARYLGSVLACWARQRPAGVDACELHSPREFPSRFTAKAPWIESTARRSLLPPLLWENVELPRRIRSCDAFLAPSNTLPLFGTPVPSALIAFDALPALRPRDFDWRGRLALSLLRTSVRRADALITISRTSRDALAEAFGLDPQLIHIARPGVDRAFRRVPELDLDLVRRRAGLDSAPFLLFVGKFSKRRNVPLLIRAAGELARRGYPHRLVLAGYNHLKLPLDEITARAGARVTYLEGIPDDLLVGLYNAADVFVQAADYEPFSLPLLEAMACGTPAVTVASSGMEEIGGDAVHSLPRPDAAALAEAVIRLLDDPGLRAQAAAAGVRRAAEFTWEEPARGIAAVLVDLASKRGSR